MASQRSRPKSNQLSIYIDRGDNYDSEAFTFNYGKYAFPKLPRCFLVQNIFGRKRFICHHIFQNSFVKYREIL